MERLLPIELDWDCMKSKSAAGDRKNDFVECRCRLRQSVGGWGHSKCHEWQCCWTDIWVAHHYRFPMYVLTQTTAHPMALQWPWTKNSPMQLPRWGQWQQLQFPRPILDWLWIAQRPMSLSPAPGPTATGAGLAHVKCDGSISRLHNIEHLVCALLKGNKHYPMSTTYLCACSSTTGPSWSVPWAHP